MNRLNFKHVPCVLFLAFVSYLYGGIALAQTYAQSATKEAEALIAKGDLEKATQHLWKSVDKLQRKDLIFLAQTHEKKKEASEMIRALNLVLAKNASDVEALTLQGKAFALQNKKKDAMEAFKKAVEINNKYEPAYNELIKYYENRNPPYYSELRIIVQDMIDNIGARSKYLAKLCEINSKDMTHEDAITSCKAAIAKDNQQPESYIYLGLSYRATDNDIQGIKMLQKTAKDFPKSELAQFSYAKVLEEQKNYLEAMNFYKAGTDAEEMSARCWVGLANTAFEIKKFEVALIAYKKACKFDRKFAAAFRKAAANLRISKNAEWTEKFQSSSESCSY